MNLLRHLHRYVDLVRWGVWQDQRVGAKDDMQRGFVLNAGSALDNAQEVVDSALGILAKLPAAIAFLEAKVKEADAEFQRVTEFCDQLVEKARQSGVRTMTKRALDAAETSIATIEGLVASAPYEALDSLSKCRDRFKHINGEIANDLRLYS